LLAPAWADLEHRGPRGADHQDRGVGCRLEHVLEQVEQGLLGPLDVLDAHHEGTLARGDLEQAARGPERLFHRELPVAEPHHRGQALCDATVACGLRKELLRRGFGTVRLVDPGELPCDLDERPEGDAAPVGKASTGHEPRVGAPLDLGDQPRLADSRLREERHEPRPALAHDQLELGRDRRELLVAALERRERSELLLSPCRREQAIGGHALGLPLQLERLDGLDGDRVTHEAIRQSSEQRLVVAGGLFEPRRDVDGVAGDEPLPGRRVACDDLAGVDADPVRQRDAVTSFELAVQLDERRLHRRSRPNGAQRIVLANPRQAEDRHHRVADELLDRAAVRRDGVAHRVEVQAHHLSQRLRVEGLGEARRPLQVAEQNRHELADLLRRDGRAERGPAKAAQAELLRVLLPAVGTDHHASSPLLFRRAPGSARSDRRT